MLRSQLTPAWTGWALLMGVALAIAAYSVFLSWQYALTWGGTNAMTAQAYASGAAAVDVFKIFAVTLVVGAFTAGRWLTASIIALAFPVMVALSVSSTFGATTIGKSEVIGSKTSAVRKLSDMRRELDSLQAELEPIVKTRPAPVIEAEISALRRNRRWDLSRGCTDVTTSTSRDFCAQYDLLFAELAGVENAVKLRSKIANLRTQIALGTTSETVRPIAPDLAVFERLSGWQLGHIIECRSRIFALVIEIVAAFGVALVWQPPRARKQPDHPRCLPGSPEGQQPSPDPGRSPCSPGSTDLLGKCRL